MHTLREYAGYVRESCEEVGIVYAAYVFWVALGQVRLLRKCTGSMGLGDALMGEGALKRDVDWLDFRCRG